MSQQDFVEVQDRILKRIQHNKAIYFKSGYSPTAKTGYFSITVKDKQYLLQEGIKC